MKRLESICVFCGSSPGNNPVYAQEMKKLGQLMAQAGIRLIYGGGNGGLMRVIADAVLENGGEVVGVYPENFMVSERPHLEVSQLIMVSNMAVRKQKMIELAQGFIIAPGGIGTMDEGYESWTLFVTQYIDKPSCLFDINGYFNKLMDWNNFMVSEGFLQQKFLDVLDVADSAEETLIKLATRAGLLLEENVEE